MKVRDIMTTGVEIAAPDSSLQEIATLMKNEDVGAIPIVEGNELAGIITDRDIVVRCIAAGKDPAQITAQDIVSEDLETVEPDDDVQEAARIMAERQVRRLPVVENGTLVGMVSIGDIAVKESEGAAGQALEEISEGVRGSAEVLGKKPVARQAGKPVRAIGVRSKVQAISDRARGDEPQPQRQVNKQRAAAGSSGRKRRRVS